MAARRVPPALPAIAVAVTIPLIGFVILMLVAMTRRGGSEVRVSVDQEPIVQATRAGEVAVARTGSGLAPTASAPATSGAASGAPQTPPQASSQAPDLLAATRAPEATRPSIPTIVALPSREAVVIAPLVPLPSPTRDAPNSIPTLTALQPQPALPSAPTRTAAPAAQIAVPTTASAALAPTVAVPQSSPAPPVGAVTATARP